MNNTILLDAGAGGESVGPVFCADWYAGGSLKALVVMNMNHSREEAPHWPMETSRPSAPPTQTHSRTARLQEINSIHLKLILYAICSALFIDIFPCAFIKKKKKKNTSIMYTDAQHKHCLRRADNFKKSKTASSQVSKCYLTRKQHK